MKLMTKKQREKLLANGADRGADHVRWSSSSTPAAPAPGS